MNGRHDKGIMNMGGKTTAGARATRRLKAAALFLLLVCSAFFMCGAGFEDFDLSHHGSLHITINPGDPSANAIIELYRVGDPAVEEAHLAFTLAPDFAGSGANLSDFTDSALPGTLAEYAEDLTPLDTRVTNADGEALFSNLEPALYLVRQNDFTEAGRFFEIQPFVVPLPMFRGNEWIYDIEAEPKAELLPVKPAPSEPPAVPVPSDSRLPQTGLRTLPIIALALVGAVLFAIGWTMVFHRKNKTYEA